MKVDNKRLEEICAAIVTDCFYDYEKVFESIRHGEIGDMAKELLRLRKLTNETYGWVAEYPSPPIGSGGMSYSFHEDRQSAEEDASEYEGFAIEVIRKP